MCRQIERDSRRQNRTSAPASRLLILLLALTLGACGRRSADEPPRGAPLPANAAAIPSFADMAARALPAVVAISTERVVPGGIAAVHPFAPPGDGVMRGAGSGFVISADGFIVTNHHVVEGATRVTVHMSDGEKTYQARVVGRDPETDIALLKVDGGSGMTVLRLGDSAVVRPGDWAIAVGNPLQFANSVTVGVVSAHGRALGLSEATAAFEDFMQTDAAINPGNSGGPLLNARGEVIGINTAVRAAAQNIGFATPVNTLKRILEPLKRDGRVRRGYLGITVADVDDRYQAAFRLPTSNGVLVQSVEPDSPADRAGIRRGDVVLEANGTAANSSRALIDAIAYAGPGRAVPLRVLRDGKEQQIRVTTGERPGAVRERPQQAAPREQNNRIGIAAAPLTPAIRQRLGLRDAESGVVVASVLAGSPAEDAGLAPGDVIVEVNGRPLAALEQLREAAEGARAGEYLRLYVIRPSPQGPAGTFYAVVRMP
jgi:serine protease Do